MARQVLLMAWFRWVLTRPLSAFLTLFFIIYLVLSIAFEADRAIVYDAMEEYFNYEAKRGGHATSVP